MDREIDQSECSAAARRERNFPALDLKDQSNLTTDNQPVLVVQSPKTPTLSRKLKAVSLDSEPQQQTGNLEVSRDVISMPNTPKKQVRQKLSCDLDDGSSHPRTTLAPSFSSNLKKFASNNSISGSQTLKTLPEINALQDFSDCPNPEPHKVRTKGLLERRGSNASLTIDLGSTQSISEAKPVPLSRLNPAKSVSNLYMSSISCAECGCVRKGGGGELKTSTDRRKSQEACNNCTIYESEAKVSKTRFQSVKRCHCCAKSRRKSLSNENLYVPPCSFCEAEKEGCSSTEMRNGKVNNRKAVFPKQQNLDSSQLSDDFELHLQNIQYLLTAGKVMTVEELKQSCELSRVPKLQQEFWEVPLNLQEKCYVSGSQSKNRYRKILPNEHSRVPLPSGGYIHANYIKGPDYTDTAYIATQGPLSHTCADFWEMVWHSQCKCIVMLTGLVEKGLNKCELYFPLGKNSDTTEKTFHYVKTSKVRDKFTFDTPSSSSSHYEEETFEFEEKNEVTYGKFRIVYLDKEYLDECQIRRLELRKLDSNIGPRIIYHYWLANWPDHKKTNAEQVLKMALDVLRCLDCTKDYNISESLSTCTKPHDQSANDLNKPSSGDQKFTFDSAVTTSCDSYSESSSVTRSDGQVTETTTSRTFTFNINAAGPVSFGENSAQVRHHHHHHQHQELQKSREGSISDFNKETLTNRCSLDSKLQNFNKMAHFKRPTGPDRKRSTENVKLPIVVHCSAGIGRTGCFLAILNGIQQLKAHNTVDILAILCSLRINRGGMVQNAEQYELIHRVLSLFCERL
ncbi:uncharacterized protein LOC126749342 [Anthonomus grandis grandis]|uniref:uncharacterized protein LOC126749342 n=1 Tax=Anthonomus grandis grandis TaxID=2921223 RepID=UPI0021663EB4|nr:uncharacterized protein LOC126749342 [Anthonomus grandis grandis]